MTEPPALSVEAVSYRYGDRQALDAVSFAVTTGEIFGLLGPNGGGKTTLFRLIATLLPLQQGEIRLFGHAVSTQPAVVRHQLGVTFQSPSVDIRLTVTENLRHHGQLYGMHGPALRTAMDRVLAGLGLQDRQHALVETLSGGLKRRVEIAKSLLPGPQFLLLDEPSTGLDPGARLDLWEVLTRLQREQGVTVLVTTHLMDEAERCDRLAILDRGRIVAVIPPRGCVRRSAATVSQSARSIRNNSRGRFTSGVGSCPKSSVMSCVSIIPQRWISFATSLHPFAIRLPRSRCPSRPWKTSSSSGLVTAFGMMPAGTKPRPDTDSGVRSPFDDVGDEHLSRAVRDRERWSRGLQHSLRSHATRPEDGQLMRVDRDRVSIVGRLQVGNADLLGESQVHRCTMRPGKTRGDLHRPDGVRGVIRPH